MRTILPLIFAVCCFAATASAQATREEFAGICAPKIIVKPPAKPETVCNCVWDKAVMSIADADLRAAALRGYRETGLFSIQNDWVPTSKRSQVQETLTKLAAPVFSCMAAGLQ